MRSKRANAAHRAPLSEAALTVVRRFHETQNKRYRRAGLGDMVVRVEKNGTIDRAPGRPQALQVVGTAEKAVTLMWKPARDDNGRVANYRVYRDGKPIAIVKNSTWFTDSKGGSEPHDYEVRALDVRGQEGAPASAPIKTLSMQQAQAAAQGQAGADTSGAAQAAAGASTLAAPEYGKLTRVDPTTFALDWKPVEGAVAYGIYQDGKLIGHTTSPKLSAKVPAGAGIELRIDAVTADGTRSAPGPGLAFRQGAKEFEVAATDPATPAPVSGPPASTGDTAPAAGTPAAPAAPTPVAPPAPAAPEAAAAPAAPAAAPAEAAPTAPAEAAPAEAAPAEAAPAAS